ncbi:ABC transporter ATP-binding protein [Halorubrum tibetense]|uniref:ABC transporter ATP-binding protein n=1 Tax=Halorubrum tibetense TaxID=175631 RepID=A0ABD5SA90_9EURY
MSDDPLLAVRDLETHYPITKGWLRREVGRVRAVDGISFDLARGETLGLVGESGSGKTTAAHSILGIETPTGGEIRFDGTPIEERSGESLRAFRRRVQLVVQDPNDALNPRMPVGEAVAEPLTVHGFDDAERRRAIAEDLLERVGLSAADHGRYPHEFSGGEKQRISIARALIVNPDLIVADEPTSALDARVRADVLDLLADIRREFDVAVLFISHDLDVVRRFCDRVAVMYLGEIVERGPTDAVFRDPDHPYTQVLRSSVPSLDPTDRRLGRPLTETVPEPSDPPSGCRFHPRCPAVISPDSIDLPRETWRSVAAFRFTVQTGELPPAVAPGRDADGSISADTVRETFDLPDAVSDDTLDETIDRAAAAIADGNVEQAGTILEAGVPTPCESTTPEAVSRGDGRSVQCLRFDPSVDADQIADDGSRLGDD